LHVALDLRSLRNEFLQGLGLVLEEEFTSSFSSFVATSHQDSLVKNLSASMESVFDKTTIMDSEDQMRAVAASTASVLLDHFNENEVTDSPTMGTFAQFRSGIAAKLTALHAKLRDEYLTGARGPAPASALLGRTRDMYNFVRKDLGIKMHGAENHSKFVHGLGSDEVSIGQNISKIYEVCIFSSLTLFLCNVNAPP